MTLPLAARVPLALVALAIAAFMAVQLYAEHRLRESSDTITQGPARGDQRRADAIRELEDVAGLQLGTEALLAASGARTAGGDVRQGAALARRAVGREPDNFGAWLTLAIALRDTNRAAALRALERAHRLNPRYRLPSLR
jgi:cytochrome c-type biogenesis protein CcmH/NrfG